MKAISLWQPWASLIMLGTKSIETRSWSTAYRGPLLIHAAKRLNKNELKMIAEDPAFDDGLALAGGASFQNLLNLPRGVLLGRVELVDCRRTDSFKMEELLDEWPYGNFESGRFGWVLERPVIFDPPMEYKGAQGLFEVHHSFVRGELT